MNESNSGHVQPVRASRNNGLREWPLRSLGVCAAAIVLTLVASSHVLRAQALSTVEQEVWNREISYWDLRASGKIDQYMDSKTNTYYVLTKLSLEDMKNNLEQARELNSQVRDFVRKNADKMFERLEKEEEKRGIQ